MHPDNVITAHGLSKAYRLWTKPSARLTSPLLEEASRYIPGPAGRALSRSAQAGYTDFYALRDVGFEVRRGEAVGIMGRNGAGKSTLLQLIAGTLQPSSGEISVRGRVAALLELGAGFNPEFTGRENVFLSGAVLGLSKAEMERRFDTVAAFADIGEFIEHPVKTYSSGMMMRLAFAVNTCVDPDILIVDEALSVGDAPFQAKCFRRLRQLIEGGVSLLFVSHDLGTVRSICSRALWLKNGHAEMWGEAKEVAKAYERFCWKEQGVALEASQENGTTTDHSQRPLQALPSDAPAGSPASGQLPAGLWEPNHEFISLRTKSSYGTGDATIENIFVANSAGQRTNLFEYAEPASLWVLFSLNRDVASDCVVSFLLRDLKGNSIIATQDVSNLGRITGRRGQQFAAHTRLPLHLHHQKYVLHTAVFGFKNGIARQNGHYDFSQAVLWDVVDEAAILEVKPCRHMPLSGPVHLDAPVTIQCVRQ